MTDVLVAQMALESLDAPDQFVKRPQAASGRIRLDFLCAYLCLGHG